MRISTDDLQVVAGNYQEALERCQERLNQVEEDSVEVADIYGIMGGIYAEYLMDEENAISYINKAMEIHQKQEDEIGLANDYVDMSSVYIYVKGDANEGIEYLEKAENIYRKHGFQFSFGLAGILTNKGHLYYKENQYENALNALGEAQTIYDKRHEEDITICILSGEVHSALQEYELAEEQYLKALQICQNQNDEYRIADVNFRLGRLNGSLSEYQKAIEYYNQALNFYKIDELYLKNVASIYNNMGYIYNLDEKLEEALNSSIVACRTIKRAGVTSKTTESKKIYKHNLSVYWEKWYQDKPESEFEGWYQNIVVEGNDWRE